MPSKLGRRPRNILFGAGRTYYYTCPLLYLRRRSWGRRRYVILRFGFANWEVDDGCCVETCILRCSDFPSVHISLRGERPVPSRSREDQLQGRSLPVLHVVVQFWDVDFGNL